MSAPSATRPPPDGEPPAGLRWVPGVAPDRRAYPAPGGRCGFRRATNKRMGNACGARAVVMVEGRVGRCVNHASGMWVEHGVVMTWALEPKEGSTDG